MRTKINFRLIQTGLVVGLIAFLLPLSLEAQRKEGQRPAGNKERSSFSKQPGSKEQKPAGRENATQKSASDTKNKGDKKTGTGQKETGGQKTATRVQPVPSPMQVAVMLMLTTARKL